MKQYKKKEAKKKSSKKNGSNYKKPPIPKGFFHVEGTWKTGFVIEHLDKFDRSQFVWVPVGALKKNATLDGITFLQRFGRRRFIPQDFWDNEYFEELVGELKKQYKSVKKYGGFYISRFTISKNKKTGRAQSIEGEYPWVEMKYKKAKKIAQKMINKDHVKSHLLYGAEYDSVLQWFKQTKSRSMKEIVEDSRTWGHYDEGCEALFGVARLKKTGVNKNTCTNGIYDFTGNVFTMTQERAKGGMRVLRGGGYEYGPCENAAATRHKMEIGLIGGDEEGLRVALWLA